MRLLKLLFNFAFVLFVNGNEIEDLVDHILIERTPGSEGIQIVQDYITSFFAEMSPFWTLETDEFMQETIIGDKKFTNIVARFRPTCEQYIVLGI